ncbi:hypothetical protein J4407_01405 [Candidatus Pacearchaeota archaeon]|nr:hypothetical protein [Candidatus Pacearchaeota archaeon]
MLIWIFMVLDILTLVTISLAQFSSIFPIQLMLFSIFYLLLKGIMFFGEPMSIIDILVAFYIFLMILGINITLIYLVILFWFLYKLIFVLVGEV